MKNITDTTLRMNILRIVSSQFIETPVISVSVALQFSRLTLSLTNTGKFPFRYAWASQYHGLFRGGAFPRFQAVAAGLDSRLSKLNRPCFVKIRKFPNPRFMFTKNESILIEYIYSISIIYYIQRMTKNQSSIFPWRLIGPSLDL